MLAITNVAGVATDPGALRLKVKAPDSTVTTYVYGTSGELMKDSVGSYHLDLLLGAAGSWLWRWESDAPNAGASEGALSVKKSVVI